MPRRLMAMDASCCAICKTLSAGHQQQLCSQGCTQWNWCYTNHTSLQVYCKLSMHSACMHSGATALLCECVSLCTATPQYTMHDAENMPSMHPELLQV